MAKLESVDNEWIWSALALGKIDFLKEADLSHFNWNQQHAVHGTPLIVVLIGKLVNNRVHCCVSCNSSQRADRLQLIKLGLAQGADPHVKAPPDCKSDRYYWKLTEEDKPEQERKKTATVKVANASALTVAMKLIEEFQDAAGEWKPELEFLASVMKLFAACGRGPSQSLPICVGVVESWDRVLNDMNSADVVLSCNGNELKAHSLVLGNCSKVLHAMFSSSLREGSSKRINVHVDQKAMKFLLELIYTGSSSEASQDGSSEVHDDQETNQPCGQKELLLAALDQAHQWQIDHVVDMLRQALAKQLSPECFASVCEVGLRLQLPELISACRNFASGSKPVREKFDDGRHYPKPVQAMLAECFGLIKPSAEKRARRVL